MRWYCINSAWYSFAFRFYFDSVFYALFSSKGNSSHMSLKNICTRLTIVWWDGWIFLSVSCYHRYFQTEQTMNLDFLVNRYESLYHLNMISAFKIKPSLSLRCLSCTITWIQKALKYILMPCKFHFKEANSSSLILYQWIMLT